VRCNIFSGFEHAVKVIGATKKILGRPERRQCGGGTDAAPPVVGAESCCAAIFVLALQMICNALLKKKEASEILFWAARTAPMRGQHRCSAGSRGFIIVRCNIFTGCEHALCC
jgi:hypothetical protein